MEDRFLRKVTVRLLLAAILGAGGLGGWRQAMAEEADKSPAAHIMVTVRGQWGASAPLQELANRGGPKVLVFNGPRGFNVPLQLRFKPMEGRKLIEALAQGKSEL